MGYDIKWGVCERVWVSRCTNICIRDIIAGDIFIPFRHGPLAWGLAAPCSLLRTRVVTAFFADPSPLRCTAPQSATYRPPLADSSVNQRENPGRLFAIIVDYLKLFVFSKIMWIVCGLFVEKCSVFSSRLFGII